MIVWLMNFDRVTEAQKGRHSSKISQDFLEHELKYISGQVAYYVDWLMKC